MSVVSTFPRIPHLAGSSFDDGDLVLDENTSKSWLQRDVRVFEKLDGINVSFMCVGRGHVRYALKDEWRGALGGRVQRALDLWTLQHQPQLQAALRGGANLYCEWLWHVVTVRYSALPAPLIGIAFRDERGRILPFDAARLRIEAAGVVPTSPIYRGPIRTKKKLMSLATKTAFGAAATEGVILEAADTPFLLGEEGWAKWVRSDYHHPNVETLSGSKNPLDLRRKCLVSSSVQPRVILRRREARGEDGRFDTGSPTAARNSS